MPAAVFALNTSMSKATKCVPYEVLYGRSPVLPEDVLWGVNDKFVLRDVTNPTEYAEEIKINLREVYNQVNTHLELSRQTMQKQYNKNLNFNDFKPGDRAWLKKKHYKTGENRKLSPRKTGPFTIIEKLPNGVNFRIKNEANGSIQNVHHDRLIPFKKATSEHKQANDRSANDSSGDQGNTSESESENEVDVEAEDSDSSENSVENSNRYPVRNRQPRIIEGAIPWDAIDI